MEHGWRGMSIFLRKKRRNGYVFTRNEESVSLVWDAIKEVVDSVVVEKQTHTGVCERRR